MKLIIGQRRSGKTTELIREILDKPGEKLVVCQSTAAINRMRDYICEQADPGSVTKEKRRVILKKDAAMYDILFIPYSRVGAYPLGNMYHRDVYIDEIGVLMQYLIVGGASNHSLTATLNDGNGTEIKTLP